MYEYKAHVDAVLDGDTLDATIDLGFHVLMKTRIRLLGINAPELHKRDQIDKARISKQALSDFIVGKDVTIITRKGDDWQRWLGYVYITSSAGVTTCVNDWMVYKGYAIPFMV